MKRNILIICIVSTAASLMAFGYINSNDCVTKQEQTQHQNTTYFNTNLSSILSPQSMTEIFYDVDSRFKRTFTKDELNKVKSMADFLPKEQIEAITSYDSVSVTMLNHKGEAISKITVVSSSFSDAQINLLRSAPYSSDMFVRADFYEKNTYTGIPEDNYTTPYFTIVPEIQAKYSYGKESLIQYVRENTLQYTLGIEDGKLQPGKVRFTVTTTGQVENVFLESTSGYDQLNNEVINLISKMPGSWAPAKNSKGEKVEQELVFSFGTIGC